MLWMTAQEAIARCEFGEAIVGDKETCSLGTRLALSSSELVAKDPPSLIKK
jgi:hypothetical protein